MTLPSVAHPSRRENRLGHLMELHGEAYSRLEEMFVQEALGVDVTIPVAMTQQLLTDLEAEMDAMESPSLAPVVRAGGLWR